MYDHQVRLLVASYTAMAHSSLPGRLVRYVISRDPDGIDQDRYFVGTDLRLSAAVLARQSWKEAFATSPQAEMPAAFADYVDRVVAAA